LVLYLDAGNRKSYPGSGTTWFDKSGRGNNGTLINGPTFNTANLGSVGFDGVDDYVNITSSNIICSEQSMSVCFTFKNISTGDWKDFFSLITTNNNSLVFERAGASPEVGTFKVFPIQTVTYTSSLINIFLPLGFSVTNSNIHHFTLTANTSSWNLYYNSVPFGSGSVSGSSQAYFNRVVLANDSTRSGRNSNCNIYTIQIYNRALSAQEVLQNYNATKGRFGL
jgi:hypothetical protein